MIGLFGSYRTNREISPDISKMQATIPDGYTCEIVSHSGCSLGSVSHGFESSGSTAQSEDLTVILSGEIFDLDVCNDLVPKPVNAAKLILSLVKIRKLDQLNKINGQYCAVIYDSKNHRLSLVTDRLATFPLHVWIQSGNVTFATQMFTLIADSSVPRRASFDALAQLFTMQRTIGKSTPISGVEALSAASIVEFSVTGRSEQRYWNLEWRKPNFSNGEGAELLAVALKNAVRRHSTGSDIGLLLSGGFDSRAILAASNPGALSSWTTASYEANPELAIARKVAALYESKHKSLIIDPKDTLDVIDQTVIESGGLYPASTPMSAFLPSVGKSCQKILSGHGLDNTLRGYYLPARFIKVAGSRTRLPMLRHISNKPTALEVLNHLRQGPPRQIIEKLIRKNKRNDWWQSLKINMENCLEPWLESNEPYNAWDGFILHAVSKHYAFTGMMAVRAVSDLRLPAFDNEVLDLYLQMPPSWRCSGIMAQRALKIISPDASHIENANTGFTMGLNPWVEVSRLFLRAALRRIKLQKRPSLPSKFHSTGSWQNLDALYRDEPNHRAHFKEIDNRIDSLSFGILDHDTLHNCIKEHLEGSVSHTKLLRQILTHDAWVRTYKIEQTNCSVEK